jgi:hypothetical protein
MSTEKNENKLENKVWNVKIKDEVVIKVNYQK